MKNMLQMTRTRAFQTYLSAVALGGVTFALLGPDLHVGSSLLAAGLLLAPAVIAYQLWPDTPGDTAMEILHRR